MEKKSYQILPASVLKYIAVISMVIDHFGVAVVLPYLRLLYRTGQDVTAVHRLYWIIRGIGRPAFPIYCFLLVEGYFHTRSRLRYARNLFVFALISEIPFDLGLYQTPFAWEHQNVFWTLLLGLLAMTVIGKAWEKLEPFPLRILVMGAAAAGFMAAAYLMKTDYDAWGVGTILIMFLIYYYNKTLGMTAGCTVLAIMNTIEAVSYCNVPLVLLYNGERGKQHKWLFYCIYPGHLLLLYLVYLFLKNHSIL